MKHLLILLLTLNLFANEDLELVQLAYKNGLQPVPSNFESLLKVLDLDTKELSKEKIALGKKLFFEKELSLGRDISCSTCHSLEKGGADGIPTAIGHKNRKNPFHLNTPTMLNTAFSKKLFWNGSSNTLEDQAKGPLQASFEMSITPKLAEQRIKEKVEYRALFKEIYGKNAITFNNIANALAAYEKTLVTHGKFDQYLLGNFTALNKQEKEGLNLFINKGCVGCHTGIGLGGEIERKFPLSYHNIWSISTPKKVQELQEKYTNYLNTLRGVPLFNYFSQKEIELLKNGFFHQIEVKNQDKILTTTACNECHQKDSLGIKENLVKTIAYPFLNKGGFLGKGNKKYFRVPLLRNVVRTKPYFHNGSVEKLEDAIKLMATHQSRVKITDNEIDKIVSFLKAVDGGLMTY